MNNQDQFTRHADAGRHGLILIYPPAEDASAEAAGWMREVQGDPANVGGAEDQGTLRSTPSMRDPTPESEAIAPGPTRSHYCSGGVSSGTVAQRGQCE